MALYPPIVASSMPAFDVNNSEGVRIYFTLSGFNDMSFSDIEAVHVSCRYQNNNLNALADSIEIIQKIKTEIFTDENLNRYYIVLTPSDMAEGFITDRLYKVQLRFSAITKASSSSTTIASFFTDNIDAFSQWSTVCIIKPITPPLFYIEDFDRTKSGKDSQQTDQNNFYSSFADFVVTYKQDQSTEILKSWRLRLLNTSFTKEQIDDIDSYVLVDNYGNKADTGFMAVSANNYNLNSNNLVLEGYIPYNLISQQTYKLYVEILTKNDFSKGILYNFKYDPQLIEAIPGGQLDISVNEEEGYVHLHFTATSTADKLTNMVIRRTDSKSNFIKWEDLKNFQCQDSLNFDYYDFTVESGILYRYLVQKRDSRGRRGTPTYDQSYSNNTGIMVEWEHAFLLESTGNGQIEEKVEQLKMKYDFQISSYKTNISESKTDTIGSKYPYIRRNGNMYYRSFPITGTITAYMDQANLLTSDNQIYNSYTQQYKNFNDDVYYDFNSGKNFPFGETQAKRSSLFKLNNSYDYTRERLFREKVEKFLYNAKPKLYKSMQEGNIFIKLMQVSLTPKQQLGRMIYTFSATAYEIDEACIDTYNKYNLISVGTYNPNLFVSKTVMSQLSSYDENAENGIKVFKKDEDIMSKQIYNQVKYQQSFNKTIVNDFYLDWLRITIESQPYLILEESPGVYRVFDDISGENSDRVYQPINYPLYQLQSTYTEDDVYLGWLFEINGKPIIVAYPNNIYELKQENFKFNANVSIIPKQDTVMNIDYRAQLKVIEDISLVPKNIETKRVNAQLVGPFASGDNLINQITAKYRYIYNQAGANQKEEKIKRQVNDVQSVLVDTEPGTVIKIRQKEDIQYRFVINQTGELNFDPETTKTQNSITSLVFVGRNITLPNNIINTTRDNIDNPRNGQVCLENNIYYCFYKDTWYSCDLIEENGIQSLDIKCPSDGLVFYLASVKKEYYDFV